LERKIAVKVNDKHEVRSRKTSRTRYTEPPRAGQRKREEECEESRALKSKITRLTVQVKEIVLEAL
jgi:hypothetical protein